MVGNYRLHFPQFSVVVVNFDLLSDYSTGAGFTGSSIAYCSMDGTGRCSSLSHECLKYFICQLLHSIETANHSFGNSNMGMAKSNIITCPS